MSDKEHSFTCVLSSVNISKYDEWKDTYLFQLSTIFLDAVIEDMLIKAKQEKGFERVIAFTEKSRAQGLGVLGLSTYYQQKNWVYGDFQSIQFNQMFFKQMDEQTLKASQLMARELGEPEWMKGYGERCSHRMALPPTMSTAIIQGGVSQGIEPVFANVYEQDTAGGTVYRINPPLLKLMKERDVYNEETMTRIAEDQGSVQGEDWLTDHEKEVFKTAFELNQETILLMAAHRQKAMCATGGGQGQSLNLYFTADEPEEEIARIHDIAFRDPWIFGLYYVRTLNKAMKHNVDKSSCSACEG
jgi:ribonucleoside-diphosphate reductase alpha chain